MRRREREREREEGGGSGTLEIVDSEDQRKSHAESFFSVRLILITKHAKMMDIDRQALLNDQISSMNLDLLSIGKLGNNKRPSLLIISKFTYVP